MMLTIKDKWRQDIHQALGANAPDLSDIEIHHNKILGLGHYSSPILLELATNVGQLPMDLGQSLKNKIPSCIGLAPPGFLNFYCSPELLWQWLQAFKANKTGGIWEQTEEVVYQQRRLDLLLRPFETMAVAQRRDYLELGPLEYRLGILLMDVIDASSSKKRKSIDKTQMHFIQGINDYFNQMVFLSEQPSMFSAKYHLLATIRDFLAKCSKAPRFIHGDKSR